MVSGDWFVDSREKMLEILSHFPEAMAVDMESCAIAQVCYLHRTPFVVVRAISDKPDETVLVDYQVFEAEAAAACARIVRHMVEGL